MIISSKIRGDFHSAEQRRAFLDSMPADVSDIQLEAFKEIWADAIKDVPYYAELVANGKAPGQIHTWAEFRSIPILTRQILQDRPDLFTRRSGPSDSLMKTAGSTGTPLCIGVSDVERHLMRVVKVASWQNFGYTPDSKLFLLWGHSHLLGTGWRGKLNHLRRKLADWLLGYCRVDAYRLSRETCEKHALKLIKARPLGIVGYAAALDLFARYTPHFRDRFRALGVRFVLATSEPPPRPDSLAIIEDLFGCPVVQEYGGVDFGQLAFKVRTDSFEVYGDLNYVECEAPEADDPLAYPVLITSLYRRYVPLIRYRIGDAFYMPERSSNGHVRRFETLAGRLHDVVRFTEGDAIHSMSIFHCIHQEPTVSNIQMVVADERVEIHLISTTPDDDAMKKRILSRLAQVHPLLAKAHLIFKDDLITNRAGKRRWFVDVRQHPPTFQ